MVSHDEDSDGDVGDTLNYAKFVNSLLLEDDEQFESYHRVPYCVDWVNSLTTTVADMRPPFF